VGTNASLFAKYLFSLCFVIGVAKVNSRSKLSVSPISSPTCVWHFALFSSFAYLFSVVPSLVLFSVVFHLFDSEGNGKQSTA